MKNKRNNIMGKYSICKKKIVINITFPLNYIIIEETDYFLEFLFQMITKKNTYCFLLN